MKRSRTLLAGAVAVGLTAGLLSGIGIEAQARPTAPTQAPPAASAVPPGVEVSIPTNAQEVAVSPDGQRVYVAGDEMLVLLDRDGDVLAQRPFAYPDRISSLVPSADGAVVYVALPHRNRVVALDARTLFDRAAVDFPEESCPYNLALAGGRLWAGASEFHCYLGDVELQSVDLSLTGPPVPAPTDLEGIADIDSAGLDATELFTISAPPGVGRDSVVHALALDGASTTVRAQARVEGWTQIEVASDGRSVAVLGAPPLILEADTLAVRHRLEVGVEPSDRIDELTMTPDGQHVLGVRLDEANDYEERWMLWSVDHASPVSGGLQGIRGRHYFGPAAFSPDGRTLYAGRGPTLFMVIPMPTDPARIELDAPAPSAVLEPVRIEGRLVRTDGGSVALQPIVAVRTSVNGIASLAAAVTDADGAFTIVDVPLVAGDYSYRVSRLLDLAPSSTTAIVSVRVGEPVSVPAVSLPPAADRTISLSAERAVVSEVDDVRRRLFVHTGDVSQHLYPTTDPPAVEVYDFEGLRLGRLALPGEPAGMAMSDDGSHLFVAMPTRGEVAVVDAATLQPVGYWPTAPLVSWPTYVVVAAGRVWVSGQRDTSSSPVSAEWVSLDPARPLDLRVESFGHLASVVDDPSDPDVVYAIRPSDQEKLDLSVDPPAQLAHRSSHTGSTWIPSVVVQRDGRRLLIAGPNEYDATTMAPVRSYSAAGFDQSRVAAVAAGPDSSAFAAGYHGPDRYEEDDVLAIWGAESTTTPRRVYRGLTSVEQVATSRTGSHAFVVVGGDPIPSAPPQGLSLRILHDPFRGGPTTPTDPTDPTDPDPDPGDPTDPSSPWWPFASVDALVDRLSTDLLGRPADAATRRFWTDAVAAGVDPTLVIDVFLRGSEGGGTTADLLRLHLVALGRFPTAAELAGARSRPSLTAAASAILGSTAFRQRGATTVEAYVDLVWRAFQGRGPTATERSFLVQLLTTGAVTRAGLLVGAATDPGYVANTSRAADIAAVHLGMLGRAPTPTELWEWFVGMTWQGRTRLDLVGAIQGSAEYGARYSAGG